MKINIKSIISINIILYSLIALNSYFRWLVANEVYYILFIFTTFSIAFLSLRLNLYTFSKPRILLAIALGIQVAYITLPVGIHGTIRIGYFLWFLPLFLFIFYKNDILLETYKKLYIIFVYISIFSLILFVLYNIGINIPHFKLYPEFRSDPLDNYKIYIIGVELLEGNKPISGGIFNRNCGIFAEPGHFAIYLSAILLAEEFDFNKWQNKLLLITGITTFSTYFLLFIFIIILYKIYNIEKIKYSKLIKLIFIFIPTIILLSSIIYMSLSTEAKQAISFMFIERQVNVDVSNIEEARATFDFLNYYDSFIRSNDAYFGVGFEESNESGIRISSNYKGYIFRYGIIGAVIAIISVYFQAKLYKRKLFYFIALFLIAVFLHRSWMFGLPSLYTLLLICSFSPMNTINNNSSVAQK